MEAKFKYEGFMSSEAQEFFKGKTITEERDGCAAVGTFIKLANGNTCLPSKGDIFIKDTNGYLTLNPTEK